jgi:hypothetical protein
MGPCLYRIYDLGIISGIRSLSEGVKLLGLISPRKDTECESGVASSVAVWIIFKIRTATFHSNLIKAKSKLTFFFQLLRPKGIRFVVNPSLIAYDDVGCILGYLSSKTNKNKTKLFCKWITSSGFEVQL